MPYLREYIRKVLAVKEEGTIVFLESPVQYDPGAILKECLELASGFDLVNENMDLAFFHQNVDGEVDGAAWVEDMGKFNFAIATAEGSSDFVFESLVQDCLDEFFILSRKNKNLILEVKVEDDETETHLTEKYGLQIIKKNPGILIMGNK